jgi:hypothetical protein
LQQPLSLLYRATLWLSIQLDHFLLFVPEPCRQKFIAEEVRLPGRSLRGVRGRSPEARMPQPRKWNIEMIQINNWLEKFRRWPLLCSVL